MSKGSLAATLVIAASLMAGCISAETEDEAPYEIGSIYTGKTSNHGSRKLPELSIRPLEEVPQDVSGLAPASGVTYFQTYAIISQQYYAWELISSSQLLTVNDHGGAFIDVALLQYGYGNGGSTLSTFPGVNYANETLCGTLSTLHYCNVGEIVTGFMVYYEFTVPQGGNFSAYTDSIAYPWGRKTDAITIK